MGTGLGSVTGRATTVAGASWAVEVTTCSSGSCTASVTGSGGFSIGTASAGIGSTGVSCGVSSTLVSGGGGVSTGTVSEGGSAVGTVVGGVTSVGVGVLSLSFDSFGTSTAARSGARSMVISFSPGGVGALRQ